MHQTVACCRLTSIPAAPCCYLCMLLVSMIPSFMPLYFFVPLAAHVTHVDTCHSGIHL